MKKILFNNWTLKIASLLLAFVLWFLIVQINDPNDSTTLANIPVRLLNTELLEQENKYYEVLDNTDTVRVTVKAPRSIIGQLRASDIVAEADVSKLTDINTVAITCYIPNVDVVSIESNHEVVKLNVEDRKSKWVNVLYDTTGEVAEGYMIADFTSDQTQIEVSGPESVVDKVSYASAAMDVTGAVTDMSANMDIELFDKEGTLVEQDKIKTNVNYVHMAVEVLATKIVPVEVSYMGEPAEGYMTTGVVTCDPGMVKIAGRPSVIEAISRVAIPEEKIGIEGATEDVELSVNLRDYLPDNVRLADSSNNGRANITIFVETIAHKTLEILPEHISLINCPAGFRAERVGEIDEIASYTLEVEGLSALITPLQSEQLHGTIDIAAWMEERNIEELSPGVYSISVEVPLDENITQVNTLTMQIEVFKTE